MDAFAFPQGVPVGATHDKKSKARITMFDVSHGQIVAQTTIYFWKRLYSKDYEVLWDRCLKKAFPNKSIQRNEVSRNLEKVYMVRNRVAHHEPVYRMRLDDVMDALFFLRNSLGCRKEHEHSAFKQMSELQYLRLKMDYVGFKNAWNDLCK